MEEHFFQCIHCWEEISMLLDSSTSQVYIEDCEVCCNPIEIHSVFLNGNLISLEIKSLGQ
jgi:hypothetical protein